MLHLYLRYKIQSRSKYFKYLFQIHVFEILHRTADSDNSQQAQIMLTNPSDELRGQSKSANMVPFDTLGMVCSIVNLSVRRTVFETFDFKNTVILKTGLGVRQGHWKCHRSIERI